MSQFAENGCLGVKRFYERLSGCYGDDWQAFSNVISKSSKSGKNIIIVISLDQNTAAPIKIFPQAKYFTDIMICIASEDIFTTVVCV